MTFITLESAGKRHGERWVLKEVSCEIDKGEIVVVVGPSGSGKSTLLRCINRLTEIDEGYIEVDGRSIMDYEPPVLRRTTGMVFQFPTVFPGTVRENLEYGMCLWNIRESDRARLAANALADAGLDESYMERDSEKLSGGEQQRVCLARSLVIGSGALLLDEPTASLDIGSATRVEDTLRDLKESRGLAILWVTHDMAQAERVADRVLFLRDGRVASFAPVDDFDWEELTGACH